jgi:formylmethanofuran dehydrogenase subunit E
VLLPVIIDAKRSVLSWNSIEMTGFFERKKKGDTGICSNCGEAYPTAQGPQCIACQGKAYYTYSAT